MLRLSATDYKLSKLGGDQFTVSDSEGVISKTSLQRNSY